MSGLNFLLCEIGNRTLYRDVVKADRQRQQLIDAAARTFREGGLVVSPTLTWPAPRHGRAELTPHLQAFCKLGNLIDATAIAVPFGTFDDGASPLGAGDGTAGIGAAGARSRAQAGGGVQMKGWTGSSHP